MFRQYVKVITDFQGIHCWPDCPFDEVKYLRNSHRHKIIITVKIETNKDRQIEFFMLKEKVDNIIDDLFGPERTKDLKNSSMEHISYEIIYRLIKEYKNYHMEVSASEDGQVSGIVEYAP